MAAVQLKGIAKKYTENYAVQGVDIDIKDGEFIVLVGPSGCGKTTTLRMIAGLEEISDGQLVIDGKVANDLSPAERGIAMVFQSYALYPHMSVEENLNFGLRLQGVPKDEIDAAVNNAAEILHIKHLLDRKPKALSGGQRQRVAIGRAITRKPKVFLFDEPLSNLDASLRVQMRIEFARLHQDLGATMIYVTHDQIEAMTLADRIVVFSEGRVEQIGTPLQLYHQPNNLFVAGFIGSPKMNLVPVVIESVNDKETVVRMSDGSLIRVACDGQQQLKAGDKATLGIRPEHLSVQSSAQDFGVNVTLCEQMGDSTMVYAQLTGFDKPVVVRVADVFRAEKNHALRIGVTPELAYLFDSKGQAVPRHLLGIHAQYV
ncbi:ABC transporter ATP-binding protein [Hydromonas duriensis]|uniref:Sorbitol ABC transporter ATP-binding protein /mannitol ABC transporter ATP-binding protein n=1 Tax=Hydromonas duriensis TaxID=1527608 RepID=A0A4R6Y557_9BURK|nr:sn-glycerol-3-phosphate ABC transporter ATP-binding protein UgpC [Hydromonas duriensis]TDR30396.1 sorbitol ABC transporter ATP-binding protein /mannitol ABC transporter ATP-binding protein [Hydromonas duriensis]